MEAGIESDVVTSCRPWVHEQATRLWSIDGYSWLQKKKVAEYVQSPALMKLAGIEFGLRVFPKGLREEDAEQTGSILVWCNGISERQTTFEFSLLGDRFPRKHGPFKCVNSAFIDKGESFELKGEKNMRLAEHLQADVLTIKFTVCAWSEDSILCNHASTKNAANASSSRLGTDFGALLTEKKHSDVILRASDPEGPSSEQLHAHRLILAARSPVFEKMFFGGLRETTSDAEVVMCDVRSDVAKVFLHALYTDEIQSEAWDDEDLLCHLFSACHKYQVEELQRRCEERLIEQISEESVAERLMMSDLLDMKALRKAALEFIAKTPCRLANVQATSGFQALVEQRPKLLAEILAKSVPPPVKLNRKRTSEGELPSNLEELSTQELKGLLGDRGLSRGGTKAKMIDRLRLHHGALQAR